MFVFEKANQDIYSRLVMSSFRSVELPSLRAPTRNLPNDPTGSFCLKLEIAGQAGNDGNLAGGAQI
jgi:hypothetical protein